MAIDLNSGRYSKVYGVSVTEPYFTADNVGFTGSVSYRDQTQFVSASSDFSSETIGAGFDVGYPISENQGVRFGLSFQKSNLLVTSGGSARQAIDLGAQQRQSHRALHRHHRHRSRIATPALPIYLAFFGPSSTRWSSPRRGTTTAAIARCLPTAACATRSACRTPLPGISDVEYYVASYEFLKYIPLFGRFTLQLGADLAYGMDIGDTTALPPYRQFYAGGPDTVRGYKESRLGPKDDFGRPFGGNLKVAARAEVLIPLPQKFQTSARLSWFYDMGNVFSTGDRYLFLGRSGLPVEYEFEYDKLKHSTGVAFNGLRRWVCSGSAMPFR